MDKKRWLKIEKIINNTLELDSRRERNAFIHQACQEDDELYKEVRELLQAIHLAEETNFLE